MLDIFRKIWRNKIFITFAIIIAIIFPATIYMQSDKDTTLVVTSIGIDKGEEDEYKITILAVIPQGSEDVGSNLEVFDTDGSSLSDAFNKISLSVGKKIGLAHCDCIVLSEELLEDNITKILDFFIRTKNLSTNPNILATPKSASDLLNCVKSSNNQLDLGLKSIINNQEQITFLQNTTLDRFYRSYLTPNCTFAMPIIDVTESSGGSESNSSSGGGNTSQDSGSGQSSSGESKSKIENKNEIAIMKFGKIVGKLDDDEKDIYSLLTKGTIRQEFEVEDINDVNLTKSNIIFEETDKHIISFCKYNDDGTPYMEYNVWLSIMVDQVISEDNRAYASANGIENLLTPIVEKKLREDINKKLSNTISAFREQHYDVLGLYSKFNAYSYSRWQKYLSSLDNPKDYMSQMDIQLNLHLNFVI